MNLKNIIREHTEEVFKIKLFELFNNMDRLSIQKIMTIFGFNIIEATNYLKEYIEGGYVGEEFAGSFLNLKGVYIKSLGSLKKVNGVLSVSETGIQTFGKLEYVGVSLFAGHCYQLKDLGNLNYVGGEFDLRECHLIESLGNLEYVGTDLDIRGTDVGEKYTEDEIRSRVFIKHNIYLKWEQ